MQDKDIPTIILPPMFRNPWPLHRKDIETARINSVIPKEQFNRIKRCRLEGGTIQTTMNLLWQKLCNALDKKGITSYADLREFEHFILNSELVLPDECGSGYNGGDKLPRSTLTEANASANVTNVGEATSGVRDPSTVQPVSAGVSGDYSKTGRERVRYGKKFGKGK